MSENNRLASINKTAFCCPHCNAYSSQDWAHTYLRFMPQDNRLPIIPSASKRDEFENDRTIEKEVRDMLVRWVEQMVKGKPFVEEQDQGVYLRNTLQNVHTSQCYNCNEFAIWVNDKLVYPNIKADIAPNPDLPEHIIVLFEEAREIVKYSPKGAAALLRLAIQHLCKELGESGKDINRDIASLVSKGLNPLVQKALDVVRVVGNEAVHPGTIDLDDNREIAHQLFGLLNLITEQMITHPKHVNALYSSLPEGKLAGIAQRDKPKPDKQT